MVQMKVLAVALSVVLAGGWAFAQQQGQQGSEQQQYGSPQQGGSQQPGAQLRSQLGSGARERLQQLSQAVEQGDADLSKTIDKVKQEAKDAQVIGAAFRQKQPGSPDQGVVAHVYVVSDNKIQRYTVDAKSNQVQDTQDVQLLSNPWLERISEMRGGQGAAGGQAGMGTLSAGQAQQLGQQIKQANVDFSKAIDKAKDQVDKGNVIGVFAVRSEHASPQAQQAAGADSNVFTKVFVVDQNDQLQVVTVDAKGDKVLHSDRLQDLVSPWMSSRRAGMGGTQQPGQQPGQQPSASPRGQPDVQIDIED